MTESKIAVMDPTGRGDDSALQLASRPANLRGLTVGLLDHSSGSNSGVLLQRYEELLKRRGVGEVIYVDWKIEDVRADKRSRAETIAELAAKCRVVINAVGMSGGSTTSSILEGVDFERRGIPVVTNVTTWFQSLAESIKKGTSMPDLNMIVLPHPFETLSKEEVIAIADRMFDQVVSAITADAE